MVEDFDKPSFKQADWNDQAPQSLDDLMAESRRSALDQEMANTMVEETFKDPQDVPVRFITGEAGTGKTYTVREMAKTNPRMRLCATTGIAAVNLDTITLNSLLKFFNTASLTQNYITGALTRRLRELYIDQGLRILGIDEVSMMPAEQLEVIYRAIQAVNQRVEEPMQLILTGDFAQLPPVSTLEEPAEWCFRAQCWETVGRGVERLTKVWRQSDPGFLEGLNHARRGHGRPAAQALREAGVTYAGGLDENFPGTTIFAINRRVDEFNTKRLGQIDKPPMELVNQFKGQPKPEWKSQVAGTPGGKIGPLVVKEGALVMILANDTEGAGDGDMAYGNGDLGTVVGLAGAKVQVRLQRSGEVVSLGRIRRWHECEKDTPGAQWYEDMRKAGGERGGWALGWMDWYPLRLGWATSVHKCLHPNTRIRTRKGLVKVGDVFSAHADEVWTGTGWAWVKAKANTIRPLVTIHTQSGRKLRCSPEHPILTDQGEFVQAGGLTLEDNIHIADPVGQIDKKGFDPEAWLWGALLGDGWLAHPRGEVHFAKADPTILARVAEIVEKAGVYVGVKKDGRGLHWASVEFRAKLPLGYEKAHQKKIPQIRLGDGQIQSLLAGLFDTGGSVYKSGMIFTTKSQDLAQGVLVLLLSQGIKASVGEYDFYKSGKYWQVRVGAVGLGEFKRLIPLQHPAKALKLTETNPNRVLQAWEYDPIIRIDKAGEVPMVDLELESDPHQFWADGFITHNSQGLSMDNVQIDCRDRFFGSPNMAYVALSRARTPQGLRIVGGDMILARQIKAAPEVQEWL